MSPGKRQKSEAQQAVVKHGSLGFYPFNRLALTAIAHQQASVVISGTDDAFTTTYKNQADIALSKGKTISLAGKVFSQFSDAFYRGFLPELIVVTSDIKSIPEFLEAYLDFLEKLCSLGFFSDDTDTHDSEVLDTYIPQMVIASYGMVFDVIYQHIQGALANMGTFSQWQRERILQKICRGFFTSLPINYEASLNTPGIYDSPLGLVLAGQKSLYSLKISQLLEQFSIPTTLNPNGELGIFELELNLAYSHLLQRLTPAAKQLDISLPSSDELQGYLNELGQAVGLIPGMATQTSCFQPLQDKPQDQVTFTDLTILHQLANLAKTYHVSSFEAVLTNIISQVKPHIQPLATSKPL